MFQLLDRRKGLTLAEVVIGLVVFAILMAAVSSAMVQSQKLSQANIMDNTAFTVAQGYLEQIKSISYSDLEEIAANPNTLPIPTKSIKYSATIDTELEEEGVVEEDDMIEIDDPLWVNQQNTKSVLLDLIEKGTSIQEVSMDVVITPTLNNIFSSEGRKVVEITLDFSYTSIFGGGTITRNGSVRGLKIELSEF